MQRADRLLPAEEPEVSAAVREGFEADGIDVLTGTTCVAASGSEGKLRLGCEGAGNVEVIGSHVLVAAGRTPNSDTFGLEHLDLEPDPSGFVAVDEFLRTNSEDAGR